MGNGIIKGYGNKDGLVHLPALSHLKQHCQKSRIKNCQSNSFPPFYFPARGDEHEENRAYKYHESSRQKDADLLDSYREEQA